MSRFRPFAALCLFLLVSTTFSAGCSRVGGAVTDPELEYYDLHGTLIELEEPLTDAQHTYMEAAEEFLVALSSQQFDHAHRMLSRDAKARMSLNQFQAPEDPAVAESNERSPLLNVSEQKFVELMTSGLKQFGPPEAAIDLYIQTTDPKVLSGGGDPLDVMFCIGAMPDSVPAGIRRASLRGIIQTRLTPEQAAGIARDYGMTVDEVYQDEDFSPYFSVKLVLVEEDGGLKVGYFELLPPSIFD